MLIDIMFCVKDEKKLKEGQMQVLSWIAFSNCEKVPFYQMVTDQGQIQFLALFL